MSSNGLTLTLTGWVGTEPKHFPGSTPFTTFRMASTRRFYDARQSAWVDGRTLWFTVKVWREAALNVAESLRKSDPVVVTGRLGTEEWESPEGPRSTLVLEATSIGPDLTYGQARFVRTVHRSSSDAPDGGAGESAEGELQDHAALAGSDPLGELFETTVSPLDDGDLEPERGDLVGSGAERE
ncbi:MAG: single-stranded DNA-binding protein [Cellulomonas sp.]